MTTELAIVQSVNQMNPLEVFKPENVDDILERIKQEAANFEGDASTNKGRERNTRHKGKINSEVREALYNLLLECPGNTEAAQKLVEAIARGKIPHVSIKY